VSLSFSSTSVLSGVPDAAFAKLATVSSRPNSLPVVAVVGATAAGKSDLALDLAERLDGEIVNTDSMQVYRGMDIGTAKLPLAERRGITHHLLDVLDVTQPATVAEFQQWAREVIGDCRDRGVSPVLVGGSALYTRAILDEFEFPGTDPDVRERLEEELAEVGPIALHARLAQVDPAAAQQVLPSNGRRVVRALEVIEITGRPFTASLPEQRYHYDHAVQVGVDIDRKTLNARIEQRVAQMWDQGFVDEVRALADRGLREGRTASRALGYQQILAFLDGDLTEDEAREKTVTGTRRFARRQDSWFRKDPRITWVRYDDPQRVEQALAAIS
jgi:tRNA dimethylallyltransferase